MFAPGSSGPINSAGIPPNASANGPTNGIDPPTPIKTGATPKPELKAVPAGQGPAKPAGRRVIHYRKQRYESAVYHRRDLLAGQHLDGPAIVEQEDTTTLVPAGFRASVDAFGNLVIEGR